MVEILLKILQEVENLSYPAMRKLLESGSMSIKVEKIQYTTLIAYKSPSLRTSAYIHNQNTVCKNLYNFIH
jgi:hypothetical protein